MATKNTAVKTPAKQAPRGLKRGELPKVRQPSTLPDDVVPFRPTLGKETIALLKWIGMKWKKSGTATALQIVNQYATSKAASAPLAGFFIEVWADLQLELDQPGQTGTLFLWKKRDYDNVKALSWDERWYVGGKMSVVMRMMIWHTAITMGIKPAKFLDEFEKSEKIRLERLERFEKKKAAKEKNT